MSYCISSQENVDLGELMFSLCYLPTAGRLTITMIKARNLKAMDITGASGGFRKRQVVKNNYPSSVYFFPRQSILKWSRDISSPRSVCKSVPDVWGPEAEEEEDVNKAEHSEPGVQWGHCVRCSSWEHRPDQPAHSRHGLRSVSIPLLSAARQLIRKTLLVLSFLYFRVGHNEVIGVCRVGNEAESLGRDHWSEMLTYPRKPIARWHPLIEVWAALFTYFCFKLSLYHVTHFSWWSQKTLFQQKYQELFVPRTKMFSAVCVFTLESCRLCQTGLWRSGSLDTHTKV